MTPYFIWTVLGETSKFVCGGFLYKRNFENMKIFVLVFALSCISSLIDSKMDQRGDTQFDRCYLAPFGRKLLIHTPIPALASTFLPII